MARAVFFKMARFLFFSVLAHAFLFWNLSFKAPSLPSPPLVAQLIHGEPVQNLEKKMESQNLGKTEEKNFSTKNKKTKKPTSAKETKNIKKSTLTVESEAKIETDEAGTLLPARILRKIKPEYPLKSRLNNEFGEVFLQLEIDENGKVTAVGVKKSSGFIRLDHSAQNAARAFLFSPAQKNGKNVVSTAYLPIRFELK